MSPGGVSARSVTEQRQLRALAIGLLVLVVLSGIGYAVYWLFNPQAGLSTEMSVALLIIGVGLGITMLSTTTMGAIRLIERTDVDKIFNPGVLYSVSTRAYMKFDEQWEVVFDSQQGNDKLQKSLDKNTLVYKRLDSTRKFEWYPGYFDTTDIDLARRYVRFLLSEPDTAVIGIGMLLNMEPAFQNVVLRGMLDWAAYDRERKAYGIERNQAFYFHSEASLKFGDGLNTVALVHVRDPNPSHYAANDQATWQQHLHDVLINDERLNKYAIPHSVWKCLCGDKLQPPRRVNNFPRSPWRHRTQPRPTATSSTTGIAGAGIATPGGTTATPNRGAIAYTNILRELKAYVGAGGRRADVITLNTQPTPVNLGTMTKRVGPFDVKGKRTYRLIETVIDGRIIHTQQQVWLSPPWNPATRPDADGDETVMIEYHPPHISGRQIRRTDRVSTPEHVKNLRSDDFGFGCLVTTSLITGVGPRDDNFDFNTHYNQATVYADFDPSQGIETVEGIELSLPPHPTLTTRTPVGRSESNEWYAFTKRTQLGDDAFSVQPVSTVINPEMFGKMIEALSASYGELGFEFLGWKSPKPTMKRERGARVSFGEFEALGDTRYVVLPVRTKLIEYIRDGIDTALTTPPNNAPYVIFVIPTVTADMGATHIPTRGESAWLVRDGKLHMRIFGDDTDAYTPQQGTRVADIPPHLKRMPNKHYGPAPQPGT